MKQTVIRLLTGGAIPPLLLLVGGFFLLYLRGAPLRFPRRMLRAMTHKSSPDGVSPFRAVTLALAGTLGVGSEKDPWIFSLVSFAKTADGKVYIAVTGKAANAYDVMKDAKTLYEGVNS